MKNTMSGAALLCLALLLSAVQTAARQGEVFKKFAGTYVTGHEFGGGSTRS
ncbi:MAG TPA: hypothetical protein VJ866_16840 [Pyrinomonadaceae bacterium]|nr:hypothetical protein [Pyrinomonadaceae bacterium]